jgi:phospholipid N-methyltransferase
VKRFFAREALTAFRTTAAIAPSSRWLSRAMVEPLFTRPVRTIVEFGAGTGSMTRTLLERMPRDATLIAFEINDHFFDYLSRTFSDPRLKLVHASVEELTNEVMRLGHEQIDAVLSSIAMGFLPAGLRHAVLSQVVELMGPNGVFTQFQYLHGHPFQKGRFGRFDPSALFRQYFQEVERTITWRNLPPAFVFSCYR